MAFWIKMLLLAGLALGLNVVARSEPLLDACYGLFGTPEQTQAYLRASALRGLRQEGANPRSLAIASKLP
jgi:hypothetical protein